MGQALRDRIKQDSFSSHSQEALLNIVVVSDYLRQKFEEICHDNDMTPAQYNVLRILKGIYPNGHARCDISKRMLDRSPDVTRLVDNLVKKGLAQRLPSDTDARLSIARITKKGLKALDELWPVIEAFDRHLEQRLSPEEILNLSELCEKIYSE